MEANSAAVMFDQKFNSISKEIDYDPSWANGTGYFNHAVDKVKLSPGEEAKSSTVKKDKIRHIIFIGTQLGTVVVFQREAGEGSKIVYNASKEFKAYSCMDQTVLDEQHVLYLLGGTEKSHDGLEMPYNIGHLLSIQIEVLTSIFGMKKETEVKKEDYVSSKTEDIKVDDMKKSETKDESGGSVIPHKWFS